jgi:hypothetical protein
MKFLLMASAGFAATLALSSAAAEETKSSVRFSNSDRLTGSMESLSKDLLIWKSPILEKATPFFLKGVIDLTLPAEQPDITARHEASVTLTNGDLIRGQVASVSDDVIELDTWFAGRMKFNRLNVSDIRITERPDFFYRGPTGLEGWKQSGDKSAWSYQGSGFRSNSPGGIARNVNLPDECSISFDAAWRGSFALKLAFFSDDLTAERPSSGYEINFQQRSIQLRTCKPPQRFLGNTHNAISLQENEKARIEVRASLKSGKICVFVDGQIVEVWTDPDVARNDVGRGIHFIALNTSPVKISRIEVGSWDGEVDQLPDPQALAGGPPIGIPGAQDEDEENSEQLPKETPQTGRMELRNGDSITGEVVSITDGIITVKTPFREVKLPIEVLRSLALKPVALETCKLYNGDVRGWFPDGSSIVFRLDGTGEGTLTGFSQNFGTATFKTAAFSRIEFNLYDQDKQELRVANGW